MELSVEKPESIIISAHAPLSFMPEVTWTHPETMLYCPLWLKQLAKELAPTITIPSNGTSAAGGLKIPLNVVTKSKESEISSSAEGA